MTARTRCSFISAALLALMNACTVGPDYNPPVVDTPEDWNAQLPQDGPADPDELARWWTTFRDPELTDLIDRALRDNLGLQQAALRIEESRARRAVTSTGQFPTINARGLAARFETSESLPVQLDDDLYAIGFDAGWEADIFGRVRRMIEAADAGTDAMREAYNGVLVTLSAEVALTYVEYRAFQESLAIIEEMASTQQRIVDLLQESHELGRISRAALEQATTQLALTRSRIPLIRTGLEQTRNRLSLLIDARPGSLDDKLASRTGVPTPPPTIALGVPAETLRRRPDVRQAERALAAQSALVGVATADLYPRLRLFGSIGLDALAPEDLFSRASAAYGFGPSVQWNIFDAGRVRRQIEIQSARQEQALLAYEQTVSSALHDVENAIVALAQEQIRRAELRRAESSAASSLTIARDRHQAGETGLLEMLQARLASLDVRLQALQSDAQIASHTIRLYKALGGGWSPLDPDDENADATPPSAMGETP